MSVGITYLLSSWKPFSRNMGFFLKILCILLLFQGFETKAETHHLQSLNSSFSNSFLVFKNNREKKNFSRKINSNCRRMLLLLSASGAQGSMGSMMAASNWCSPIVFDKTRWLPQALDRCPWCAALERMGTYCCAVQGRTLGYGVADRARPCCTWGWIVLLGYGSHNADCHATTRPVKWSATWHGAMADEGMGSHDS